MKPDRAIDEIERRVTETARQEVAQLYPTASPEARAATVLLVLRRAVNRSRDLLCEIAELRFPGQPGDRNG